MIKTASWFTTLSPDHIRIGISRGTPRRFPAGYRRYPKLNPGAWFNFTSSPQEYERLYQREVLSPLDPRQVADEIEALAGGKIAVLCCYERVGGPGWCHRALAARWLAEALGELVPEVGFEHLAQDDHPLMAPELRR